MVKTQRRPKHRTQTRHGDCNQRVQHRSGKPGFSGAEGAFRTLKRALRLCRSSRPRLERGGRRKQRAINRGPRLYHDLPGDRLAKPQQSRTIRTARPDRAALRERHPKLRAYPRRGLLLGPPGAQREDASESVRPVVVRRSCPPTQVTGRNPLLLRFRSRVSPAVARFSRSRGMLGSASPKPDLAAWPRSQV